MMDYLSPFIVLVLETSLAGTLAVIMTFAAKSILGKNITARWHHIIWFVVILRLMMPIVPAAPVSVLNLFPEFGSVPKIEYSSSVNPVDIALGEDRSGNIITPPSTADNASKAPSALPGVKNESKSILTKFHPTQSGIFIFWLLGAFIVYLWAGCAYLKFKRKLHLLPPTDNHDIIKVLDSCRLSIGMKKNIKVYISPDIELPCVFGVIRPKILIPDKPELLETKGLKYVLLHELAHIKRRDNTINLIMIILQGIHWFNPVIWWAFSSVRRDAESACDLRVINCLAENENSKYAETLLHLTLNSFKRTAPVFAGFAESKSDLRRRVENIMINPKRTLKSLFLGILAISLLAASACTGRISSNLPETRQTGEVASVKPAETPKTGETASLKPAETTRTVKPPSSKLPVFNEKDLVLNKIMVHTSTFEDVKKILGEPKSKEEGMEEATCEYFMNTLYDGMELQYYKADPKGSIYILKNIIITGNGMAGPRGIKIGDSLESLLSKFPSRPYDNKLIGKEQVLYAYKEGTELQMPLGVIVFNQERSADVTYWFHFGGKGKTRTDHDNYMGALWISFTDGKVVRISVFAGPTGD